MTPPRHSSGVGAPVTPTAHPSRLPTKGSSVRAKETTSGANHRSRKLKPV
eukprot:CAMPEP_0117672856 /NCGR_PEP_ID=MMETSP0804-20121206/14144_1 /TAXON_ID=1074897 /ORGANISM="Tetraselmis astigmatica, Strain CCMP880" /LENGTH=49 /DNA_ID=CAMNT_0005481519 /DNA_START=578 /DNA_END=727 /DNA_ORIENTATION=+